MHSHDDYQVIIPAAGCSRRLARLTEDKPKSLLTIDGKSIVEHSLDIVAQRGFRRVTFVVGYQRELFMQTLGTRYQNLDLEYVIAQDYASTEHGWSFYLCKTNWQRQRSPVVFMDADNLYDPAMLDRVLTSSFANAILIDPDPPNPEQEDELVLGAGHVITGLQRGIAAEHEHCVGRFVGINRFSAEFMRGLFDFMDRFFASHDRQHKYERVIDAYLKTREATLNYVTTGSLAWVNINSEADYALAQTIARSTAGEVRCA